MSTTEDTNTTRRGSESNDLLGLAVKRALFADECQRLAEWALIGPVQRAALESFAERLLAAERDRCRRAVLSCCGDDVIGAAVLAVIDGAQDWQQEADGSWTLSA